MNILLTCIGRRVSLVENIRETIPNVNVIGVDCDQLAPALSLCDVIIIVPKKIDEQYFLKIDSICDEYKIDLIIPLIDTELLLFASKRDYFLSKGVNINISPLDTIRLFRDKYNMYLDLLSMPEMNQPQTCLLKDYKENMFQGNKVILKPRGGSSSAGIYCLESRQVCSFANLMMLDHDAYLVQAYIPYEFEVTIDVFVGRDGDVLEMCQRRRIKTRGGEVSQGITMNDSMLAAHVIKLIKRHAFYGVVNIQFMFAGEKFFVGEVNPRFGGGYPLAHKAGANLIEHFISEKKIQSARYQSGLKMLRYDAAIFI
ncbi:MAG: hypothetical protein CMF42_02100 [Legionellales bacterium]|nr:hypothetical protein [Legionellales bacterium]|tara:strand:+ start:1677 stop:2615 length:939 start_codon:yes stop_codon:yes gene_type:complete